MAELRASGRTVLLSSHILSEAEALSDRVSIIRDRIVVESGTLSNLRHLTRTARLRSGQEVPAGLADIPGVHDLVIGGTSISAQVDAEGMDPLVGALARANRIAGQPSAHAGGVVPPALHDGPRHPPIGMAGHDWYLGADPSRPEARPILLPPGFSACH